MTTTETPRICWRLPHWGWFLGATLGLVTLAAGLAVWLPYHREQQIVELIENNGGEVSYENGGPDWLRRIVGDDQMKLFDRVRAVSFAVASYRLGRSISEPRIPRTSRCTFRI